jgi:hypothetical protein
MTANQRRPGFRLPWSSEGDQAGAPGSNEGDTPSVEPAQLPGATTLSTDEMSAHTAAESAASAEAVPTADSAAPTGGAERAPEPATHAPEGSHMTPAAATPTVVPDHSAADATTTATASAFLGDLVSAMRRVAEEARDATMTEVRARAEEAIRGREARLEARRNELRANAEADIARVGEWAKAEAERIKAEAEQRVAARRAELERQLAAEASRGDLDPSAVNARVSAYEAELDRFYAQLSEIDDPAAFAAAAKRMPVPPSLDDDDLRAAPAAPAAETAPEVAPDASTAPTETAEAPATNGAHPASPVTDASGADVAAAELSPVEPAAASVAGDTIAEPVATEIVVKGLGSFGAITGFRQQLAGVEGIDAVGLSLGTSGEFVFRATHRPSVDVSAAISGLEGEGTVIEPRAEGGLRVTLARPR